MLFVMTSPGIVYALFSKTGATGMVVKKPTGMLQRRAHKNTPLKSL